MQTQIQPFLLMTIASLFFPKGQPPPDGSQKTEEPETNGGQKKAGNQSRSIETKE